MSGENMITDHVYWTKELKYTCKGCPATFDDEAAVRAHLKAHGNEKV